MKGWKRTEIYREQLLHVSISVSAQCATPSDKAARHLKLYNIPLLCSPPLLARMCQYVEGINKHSCDKHSEPTLTH